MTLGLETSSATARPRHRHFGDGLDDRFGRRICIGWFTNTAATAEAPGVSRANARAGARDDRALGR